MITTYDVLAALIANSGKYIEFKYKPLPECKVKMTPSRAAALESTIKPISAMPEDVGGFFCVEGIRITKAGDFIVTLRNMKRKNIGDVIDPETGILLESYYSDKSNKQEDGSHKEGFDTGEFLFRSYRLDVRDDGCGINLGSMKVNNGKYGKQPVFARV
jgi:hypothetical protein